MQHPVHDEELFMEEAVAAIRQAISNDEAGETRANEPTPEAGLLSREATAAVGSAFNTLIETIKKQEPTRCYPF